MESIRARKRPTPAPAAERPLRSADSEASSDRTQLAGFTDLPAEIHLLISKQLIYPDALSLKHTSSYFYYLVDTGVRLKVEWLMERRMLHLECPNDKRCDLGSDLRFCRGSVPGGVNTWSASQGQDLVASCTALPYARIVERLVQGVNAG
ncbi:F-box domain-containing protein [Colletotrichum orchidophilum]|uniref:F-box domain-containing protein n=1 Tax=Colletotrichum orchidophilum TaxID=1209926 RepID=A0A1G4B5X0_9PEZI|nr:F-box domain-containing protein [Colletotrichum orchidophilum]OHE96839.1 F-box domain-containing protein [Colletotrichum orchidophilum]